MEHIFPPWIPRCSGHESYPLQPLVYPDPNRCDLFRFSKMRASIDASIGSEAQYGFTTVDDHVRFFFFIFM
jgi:hypothetical protein